MGVRHWVFIGRQYTRLRSILPWRRGTVFAILFRPSSEAAFRNGWPRRSRLQLVACR